MKEFAKKTGLLAFTLILLTSCGVNPEGKDKKSAKELTLDQKALNTFENTTIVFTGSMVVAFSNVFKGQAEAFSNTFAAGLNKENIKALDEQIAGLGEQVINPLENLITHMDSVFNEMTKKNRTIYEKMFLHDVMKEGVAITEKYELPDEFRPLSQNLSMDELKRYILKVTADSQNTDDPIIKTYIELFDWFKKVGKAFEKDTEIQNFMKGLR